MKVMSSSKTKKQKLPKWFDGVLYTSGATVTNPFSGQSYDLTAEELSMYDFILGCQWLYRVIDSPEKPIVGNFQKGLNWFRKNNVEAYIILLD